MFKKTTKCKDCGGVVSIKAKTCPHCGAGKPAKGGTNVSGKTSFLVIAITIIVIFANFESFENLEVGRETSNNASADPCEAKSPQRGHSMLVKGNDVNARTGPGTNYPKFAIPFQQGEGVSFLCQKSGWTRFMDRDGNIGWMKSTFLERQEDTPSSIAKSQYIASDSYFGCIRRDYFEKLLSYAVQKDFGALQQGLSAGVLAGQCVDFKAGEEVFITDTASLSGIVKVRRRGSTTEYWTNYEAIIQ
jgi:hypothetical protein